ncbi:MAG: nucleotidyltransferase domain-containing protein [bacterium]
MVKLTVKMKKTLIKYIERLSQDIDIDKVILFGSRATRYARPDSDIDLAIISPSFIGKRSVDVIAYLLSKAHELSFDVSVEPLGFTPEEYGENKPWGVLDEIQRKGVIIFENGRFLLNRGKKAKIFA